MNKSEKVFILPKGGGLFKHRTGRTGIRSRPVHCCTFSMCPRWEKIHLSLTLDRNFYVYTWRGYKSEEGRCSTFLLNVFSMEVSFDG